MPLDLNATGDHRKRDAHHSEFGTDQDFLQDQDDYNHNPRGHSSENKQDSPHLDYYGHICRRQDRKESVDINGIQSEHYCRWRHYREDDKIVSHDYCYRDGDKRCARADLRS